MANYWKSKVLPKIKKVFEKNSTKKAAAAEACKTFDESKEEYSKAFEENKAELQPKVVEIYEATSAEIKGLVKDPKDYGLKKHSVAVQKFIDELVKIEFPGSKAASEASSSYGPAYVSGPIVFLFEKVSMFVVTEEKKDEEEKAEAGEGEASAKEVKEKDIVIEEEKKEETAPAEASVPPPEKTEEAEKKEEAQPAEPPAPAAAAEPAKAEEAAAPPAEQPKA